MLFSSRKPEEEIHMKLPTEIIIVSQEQEKVCKLKKAVYGLTSTTSLE